MKINIQSISDIITNSSTEVYTIYSIRDKQTIKEIVNALLSVNGDLRFDDLFNIGMMVSEWAAETLWEESPDIQEQFPTLNDFDKYLATLTDDELENYADKYENIEYIHKVRMKHAKIMLATSQTSIIDIALSTGYPTISSFNRQFLKQYKIWQLGLNVK